MWSPLGFRDYYRKQEWVSSRRSRGRAARRRTGRAGRRRGRRCNDTVHRTAGITAEKSCTGILLADNDAHVVVVVVVVVVLVVV